MVGAAAIGAFAALVVGSAVSLAASSVSVSQRGREFTPAKVTIRRGDTIEILNDDGDLRHHAYIDSDKFTFDSGDQEPGTKAVIRFPISGDFEVLCAIHPKMKLAVQVK